MASPSRSIFRTLGGSGLSVFPIGLGCMSLSGVYGKSDDEQGIRVVHHAIDRGVNFLDSSDMYGWGHNETLLGKALAGGWRAKVVLATKFGQTQRPGGANGVDGRPEYVKAACEASLKRLGVDVIDLYFQHRVDPSVPIEDTVGAMADLVKAGKLRALGLSEARPETIRRAHAVHPVSDLQIEYSLMSRGIEKAILPTTRELGVGITAYGVLSRGMLSGRLPPASSKGDIRIVRMPRFQQGNVEQNLRLVEALRQIGDEKGASPAQLALAWVRSRGDDILPVMGARRRDQLKESLDALELELSADDLARIDAAVSPELTSGERYDPTQMAHLDSEAAH